MSANKRKRGFIKMERKNKIISKGLKIFMKILPLCAMAMTLISANATACWIHGQPEAPKNLKSFEKFYI